MADVVQKMYGAFTGGALDDVATVDVQENGFIEGVLMVIGATGADALNDEATIEISFGSTNTFTVNDVRVSICMLTTRNVFLTSGGGNGTTAIYVPVNLRVNAGERIHMHLNSDSGMAGEATAYLYLIARGGGRRSPRRR